MRDAYKIRPIEPRDDAAVASIIRAVMPEFGADGPGFAIHDAEVDTMSSSYSGPAHAYFVVENAAGTVVGGAGVGPLSNGDVTLCELRKMYFLPEARGRGVGARLLTRCLDAARSIGFTSCYIETLVSMHGAQKLYEKAGFKPLPAPLGATGHFGCDRFYLLTLTDADRVHA